MVDSKIEDRAVKLSREAVELIDAGHKEVRIPELSWISTAAK
jgi:hypothetical protein